MPRAGVTVIRLHADAPAKPAAGAPCNGCGACCAWQPCPLGMLLSRRRRGACVALSFDASAAHYRCGALATPGRWLPWLPAGVARALVQRWIAAGRGCDADFDTATEADTADGPERGDTVTR